MIGLGTLINAGGILAGGICGLWFGKRLAGRIQETLHMACGVSVLFLGIAGAMEGMLRVDGGALATVRAIPVVLCLVLGALIGEILNLESGVARFGEWLKRRTGNAGDANFVHGFVAASLTVCVGAMAVVGAIQDGISGDYSVLATKSILDFILVMVMTCALGKGCLFSAVPVALFEGAMTLLAGWLKPLLTDAALLYLSMVGSILIFCVGLNLVWGQRVRTANFLPALILAVIAAMLLE